MAEAPEARGHRCVRSGRPLSLRQDDAARSVAAFASGTTSRRGSVRDGNSVGDHVAEARARQMSTEINVAEATYLGDHWTILDCPGSVELLLRGAAGDAGRRRRGRRLRARGRARGDGQRAVALSRPPQHPAHDLHQQARHRERAGARRAGGAAIGIPSARWCCARCRCATAIGHHRLCRSGQRARLPIPAGPGVGPDPAARPVSGTARREPAPASSKSSPISTTSCSSNLLEDVQPSKEEIYKHLTQGNRRRADRAGVCRLGACRISACGGCGRRCATTRRARGRPPSGSASPPRASRWRR